MNLCVVGAGGAGVVTAAVFAYLGHRVICVDSDPTKIDVLRRGWVRLAEPGLDELVERTRADGHLTFDFELADAVQGSEAVFITVGPSLRAAGVDLSAVEDAARAIGRAMDGSRLIVIRACVPLGGGSRVGSLIAQHRSTPADFDLVVNPDLARPGRAVEDTLRPDRMVLGVSNRAATAKLLQLYGPLECPMLITDVLTAEVIGLATSALRAVTSWFATAVVDVCALAGVDGPQVLKGVGLDQRIGSTLPPADLGGGASLQAACELLLRDAAELGCELAPLRAAIEIDRGRAGRVAAGPSACGSEAGSGFVTTDAPGVPG